MQENLIIVSKTDRGELLRILNQFIELYHEHLPIDFKIKLYKKEIDEYYLVCDNRIDNEIFNYLISYIKYPEDIEVELSVVGYKTLTNSGMYPENLLNQFAMIFTSTDDEN